MATNSLSSGQAAAPRRELAENPWFWLHVFCVAALIGVTLVKPKYAERQAAVERKFQGRQRAALQRAGQAPDTPLSTPEHRYLVLQPIYVVLGVGAAGAWVQLWRTHFRGGRGRGLAPPATAAGDEPRCGAEPPR